VVRALPLPLVVRQGFRICWFLLSEQKRIRIYHFLFLVYGSDVTYKAHQNLRNWVKACFLKNLLFYLEIILNIEHLQE
jgi:hypothetical protein